MNRKQWDSFLTHLDIIERRTKRVLRHQDDWEWRHYQDHDLRDFREEIDERLQSEMVQKVLHTLSDRERKVLNYRFGLIDGVMLTLDQVGEIFNVQRERVRQIECRAIRKLRHPSRIKMMFCPLDWEEREIIRREEERKQAAIEAAERKRENEEYQKWYDNGGREELQKQEQEEADRRWKHQERVRLLRQQEYENMLARQKLDEQARKDREAKQYGGFRTLRPETFMEKQARIDAHLKAYGQMLSQEAQWQKDNREAQEKAERECRERQELIDEMKFMGKLAITLVNEVRDTQRVLSKRPIAREGAEDDDTRPYVWNAIKKQKRYLKKDGTYE